MSVDKLGALLIRTPRAHCAISRSTFVCMIIILVNLRIVEMLFQIIISPGDVSRKKHSAPDLD